MTVRIRKEESAMLSADPKKARRVLACLGLLVICLAAVSKEGFTANESAEVKAIRAAEQAWPQAAVDQDADRMASFMADEYVQLEWEPANGATPAHWVARGKKEWVAEVRSGK
jgi:hypothetical protein